MQTTVYEEIYLHFTYISTCHNKLKGVRRSHVSLLESYILSHKEHANVTKGDKLIITVATSAVLTLPLHLLFTLSLG